VEEDAGMVVEEGACVVAGLLGGGVEVACPKLKAGHRTADKRRLLFIRKLSSLPL
jgi:hypothetical protein